ncbi:MAG: superoxide dismutase [Lentimicrobiaceae bacterium]|jgi:Fe-Mn family superoxide dismutase|nr:superoxide dismutase [Lentimicrobiaceae bacterium]MDD4597079.1 superoxide dismutase [Lentimicrobiaceae bacterium]MDY0026143.1 superoxide dismutase [Lentimicrobium sp.]HAH58139.1 superoxide dismutase [Bacteroidales bacterium]
MKFEFPELPYAYDALEPHIDKQTMELHYTKHHKGYFDKFTAAIQGTELESKSLEEIFSNISKAPAAVRNNGGGYYNHSLFWKVLSPNGGGDPTGPIAEAINTQFNSFAEFQKKFDEAAANRFGSGWAWLCVKKDNSLSICSSPNQDNPLMDVHDCQGQPILGLDVWEHAYYLKYQNRRPEYISAFWKLVNWDQVNENYKNARR